MATFKEWKKNSRLFQKVDETWPCADRQFVSSICASAYKAGERQGRADVEKLAQHAIAIRGNSRWPFSK